MPVSPPTTDTTRLDARELRAWRGLLQVHARSVRALDAELRAEHGLPVAQYEVLMFLADADHERMRMADIADRVLVSRSGLTRLIDRLVSLGLVARCTCVDDGRGAFAKLTDAGRVKLEAARRTHLAGVRRLFLDRVSAEEQDALGDVWDRLLAVPEREAPPSPLLHAPGARLPATR